MRILLGSTLVTVALLFGTPAFAADQASAAASNTPAGTWTQIDDETGKPKSLIEISQAPDGTLQGVVKQVFFSDQGTTHPICKECEGARKDQPVVGMTIMWGVKQDGDQWDGGQILDPKNGKTYKVKLSLTDGGQKLDVHGYVGFALLGRSQVWVRHLYGRQ